jgi:hypothetical protein
MITEDSVITWNVYSPPVEPASHAIEERNDDQDHYKQKDKLKQDDVVMYEENKLIKPKEQLSLVLSLPFFYNF